VAALNLCPERIDLWLAHCGVPDYLLSEYRQLLSQDERRREERFYFARDRRRFVVSRALLRTVLSRYAPTPPRDWRFATNRYGRPRIVNHGEREQAIGFNLSHTSEVVLLAVSRIAALGVDVEFVRATVAVCEMANRFFATPERAALRALRPEAQTDRFFEYWTLKESYIKARGMGLSIPLDSFAFDLEKTGHIEFSVAESLRDDAATWRFWQMQPAAGHFAAVCARREGGVPILSMRAVVPLADEKLWDCPIVRQSAD
jgi:4'-phosphopantetheinyl transferase